MHAVSIGCSKLVYLAYDGPVQLESCAPMDYYTVHLVLAGGLEVRTEVGSAGLAPGAACVLSPGEILRMRFCAGTEQLAAKIPARTLGQALGRLGGGAGAAPITFGVRGPATALWPATLQLVAQTVDRSDTGLTAPQLGLELEHMLLSTLLLSHPHTATVDMLRPPKGRGLRAAEEAAKHIRRSPAEPVDFAELAQGLGVSLRTLQAGFRHRFGCSPSQFVRDLRLDQAHDMLRGGSGQTVTDVALACGFTHLGRFARSYRSRYGTSPSHTRTTA